jgi:hypothetical protein
MIPDKTHNELSPSSAERYFNCPGSVRLSRGLPNLPESPHAKLGTLAHSWLEYKLHRALLGKTIKAPDEAMDEAMETAVDQAVNYIGDIFMFCKESNILIEHKFSLDFIYPGTGGTADFCGLAPDGKLYVIDYKHGSGYDVAIEENKQLLQYALGAIDYFNVPSETEVVLVIIQPRTSGIKIQIKKAEEINEWANEFIAAAKRTADENAPLIPGKWCRWCKAAVKCGKIRSQIVSPALTIPVENIDQKELPIVEQLPMHQLIKIITYKEIIEKWLDSCYSYAQQLALKGEVIPGYKLVNTKANRQWIDPELVKKEFANLGNAIMAEPKLKSPKQFEDMKNIDKKALAQFYFTPPTGVTLVQESDKRKAVAGVKASSIFQPYLETN